MTKSQTLPAQHTLWFWQLIHAFWELFRGIPWWTRKWLAKIFLTLWRRYLAFQRDPFRPISRWQARQDPEKPPGTLAVVLGSFERRIRWTRKRRELPPPDENPWISSSQVEAPCRVCTGLLQYQWCSVEKRPIWNPLPNIFQISHYCVSNTPTLEKSRSLISMSRLK